MAITQADIDRLETALANGEKTVTFANKGSVTYRDVSELKAAIAYLKAELAAQSSAGAAGVSFVQFTRD